MTAGGAFVRGAFGVAVAAVNFSRRIVRCCLKFPTASEINRPEVKPELL